VNKEDIARINELGRLMRERALNEEEKAEQQRLRRAYIDEFKQNVRTTLENTYLQRPDGTREKLIPGGKKSGS